MIEKIFNEKFLRKHPQFEKVDSETFSFHNNEVLISNARESATPYIYDIRLTRMKDLEQFYIKSNYVRIVRGFIISYCFDKIPCSPVIFNNNPEETIIDLEYCDNFRSKVHYCYYFHIPFGFEFRVTIDGKNNSSIKFNIYKEGESRLEFSNLKFNSGDLVRDIDDQIQYLRDNPTIYLSQKEYLSEEYLASIDNKEELEKYLDDLF